MQDAISRLAAAGAPTRAGMTAGFIVFGAGLPAYAVALRRFLPGPAWIAAATTGLATLGVAALPLDAGVDAAHGAFAGVGYVSLAAVPLCAAVPLNRAGRRGWAAASVVTGLVSAASLAATLAGSRHGLFQRAGLTVTDLWVAATAAAMMSGRWPRRVGPNAVR